MHETRDGITKRKIILCAYACHPSKGSEPGIGWNWLKELAKRDEVFLVSYSGEGQKEAVEGALPSIACRQNIRYYPISIPKAFQGRLYRIGYEIWQRKAFAVAKKLLDSNTIDLVHHVTIAAWWFSGYLWKLNVPFMFGPVLGGQKSKPVLMSFLRFRHRLNEQFRNLVLGFSARSFRRSRRAIDNATIVFVGNNETKLLIQAISKSCSTRILTTQGISTLPELREACRRETGCRCMNLLWSGLMIPIKNFGFLFEVLPNLPTSVEWRLTVMGGGPMLAYYRRLAVEHGLASRIDFLGQVDYSDTGKHYEAADVLLFPSMREGSPTAILEAMAHELAVVAFKQNGADIMLAEGAGILIEVRDRIQVVNDFRDAVVRLYQDPRLREEIGKTARHRVEQQFLWEHRARVMDDVYDAILANPKSDRNRKN